MRIHDLSLGLIFLGIGVSPVAAQNRTPLIPDAELERLGLRRFWEANLPIAPGAEIRSANVVDDALYVAIDDGTLFALQSDVGLIRWVDKVAEPDFVIYPPSHVGTASGKGPTLVPTTTAAYLYDRFNGKRLLRFDPGFAPGGAALAVGARYLGGGADGHFRAVLMPVGGLAKPYQSWSVFVGAPVSATPALYDNDKLLFAAQNGGVYSCFVADKTLIWSFRAGGGIVGDPAVDASGAYVASLDRSLYKLNLQTGRAIWRARFESPLRDGPVAVAHSVFQFDPRRGITSLDPDSGKERWALAGARKLAAHHRMGDVFFGVDGGITVAEHETGEVNGTIDVPSAIDVVTNTADDAVYVLGTKGRVLCLRLDDVPYLRRQQVQAARAELNLPPTTRAESAEFPSMLRDRPRDETARNPLRSARDGQRP